MLDALDKAILQGLGANCRLSYQTLAKQNGVTATAVKKRIDRLLETGVIVTFTVELNLAMIDADYLLILVYTDEQHDNDKSAKEIGQHRMVSEVGVLAGSTIIAFASYQDAKDLAELRSFLISLEGVTEVEMHTLLFPRGKKMELKRLHIKILRCLVDDPRMPATEIANRTGLAVRTVTRGINEILEGEGVRISLRWNLNAADCITFLMQIEWDEHKASLDDILGWLREHFPQEFWEPLICASENMMFAAFVVETLKDMSRIGHEIRTCPLVISHTSLLGEPSRSYPDIRRYRLEELLEREGAS
jgi:DNA-binding Lrp family transcriptional regulator